MSVMLQSYAAGTWFTATDPGAPLLDAATGEEVARISSTGLDLGAMTSYAKRVGGPALRELTFHERAVLLKELGKHLTAAKDEFHALSLRTGATPRDGMVDIEGGIGTLFGIASKATRELPNDIVVLDGGLERLGREGTFVGQHVYASRPGVAVQINAFNFPVWGMLEKLAPAFIAGLPTIVKPASQTAYLTELVVRRIIESGLLPEGTLQLLSGSAGGLLDELTVQDSVAFTGSAHTAGMLRTHTNVLHGGVQLGVEADSLNCSILGPDVTTDAPEFDLFVKGLVAEMTSKAGQKCTAIRRAIVPAAVADDVVEAVAARLARLPVGNPAHPDTRIGALASLEQREEVRKAIQSLRSSADIVYGDPDHVDVVDGDDRRGAFLSPSCSGRPGVPSSRTTWSRSVRCPPCSPTTPWPRPSSSRPAARAAWSARWSPTTPTSPARSRSASRRGTAGSWSSTATTRPSPPATARRCRCSCTAARAGPVAARSSAVSGASSTTCSGPRSRPRPT